MNLKKIFNRTFWTVSSSFLALDFILMTVGGVIAQKYNTQINNVFNINPYEIVNKDNSNENTEYYKSDYYLDDGQYDHQKMRENSLSVSLQAALEGSVLLWNDNKALPLKEKEKVNLLSQFVIAFHNCISVACRREQRKQ